MWGSSVFIGGRHAPVPMGRGSSVTGNIGTHPLTTPPKRFDREWRNLVW